MDQKYFTAFISGIFSRFRAFLQKAVDQGESPAKRAAAATPDFSLPTFFSAEKKVRFTLMELLVNTARHVWDWRFVFTVPEYSLASNASGAFCRAFLQKAVDQGESPAKRAAAATPDFSLPTFFSAEKKVRFTLIELLVVIAIMAILAGLLLPSLNKAREKSRTISCINKIKNLGYAVNDYTSDFDGCYPFRKLDTNASTWTAVFCQLKYTTKKDFFCPSRKPLGNTSANNIYYDSWRNAKTIPYDEWTWIAPEYGINYKLAPSPQYGKLVKDSHVRKPSNTILFTESVSGARNKGVYCVLETYSASTDVPYAPHDAMNVMNIQFVDGHAATQACNGYGESAIEWFCNYSSKHGMWNVK